MTVTDQDFMQTEVYTGLSTAVGFPTFATAGVPFNVTLTLRNNDGDVVNTPTSLAIQITGYALMESADIIILSTREVPVAVTMSSLPVH